MSDGGGSRWVRCGVAGVGAVAGAFVLTIAAVFAYAFRLAFAVRGAPDQARIRAFATSIGPVWGPWLRVMLVFATAMWISRSSRSAVVEAVVVGLAAGIVGLALDWPPDVRAMGFFVGTIVVAILGGLVAKRRAAVPESGSRRRAAEQGDEAQER